MSLSDGRLRARHLDAVKAIYRECHPAWPMHSDRWFYSMNVLVIEVNERVVAWSAMSFSPPPTNDLANRIAPDALCAWLVDTCVTAEYRRQGLAGLLMDHRLDIAYDVGCQMAVGAAVPGSAMVKVMCERDFKLVAMSNTVYPDRTVAQVYIKELGGYDAPHRSF